jgi:threonine synthase
MPADTPEVNVREAELFGARVSLVDGTIADCGRVVREGAEKMGWFDLSTMREPYRVEGKKTMGFELAEQLGWRLPHAIFYPTGGGVGLLGMWKAFQELAHIGWLEETRAPRLYACQARGCAPLAQAFERGERFAKPPADPRTVAAGLRVPAPLADFLILDAVRASKGLVLDASDEELLAWTRRASSLEGFSLCPETGACFAALERAVREGHVQPDDRVVVFNTAAAQKYVEALRTGEAPRLAPGPVDWASFA